MIYVIGERADTIVKIGWALRPEERLKALQTGNPAPLAVLAKFSGEREDEGNLHHHFCRRHVSGEWFDFSETDAVEAVAAALGRATGENIRGHRADSRVQRRGRIDQRVLETLAAAASADRLVIATHDDISRVAGVSADTARKSVRRLIDAQLLRQIRHGTAIFPSAYQVLDKQGALDLEWDDVPAPLDNGVDMVFPWEPTAPWLIPERRVQAFPRRAAYAEAQSK